MRWTSRISFLLLVAWAIFMVSPFVALYDLSKAVEVKDVARITERVNFNALRVSLARQILDEYLKTQEVSERDRQLAAQAGAAALNPFLEQLLTPQAVIDLLEDGQLQQIQQAGTGAPAIRFDPGSLQQAWRIFILSESQGFRAITIPLTPDEPRDRQLRVTLRLSGTTWRLTGIDLPSSLQKELRKRAAVASK
ncbi:DUF2939 domain-containing protein [Microvirga sp. BT688]|uniref:DUF2939 domain-containing protein n=1 Tax=Microvirga sp. TaxID=1873136 RepID=UPI0016895752|nr:DUF2939 domain-containing protein [Microvirga sp.]MBD2748064.1 DUF2939 domain-containing protein [Microvirga sp.]